MHRILTLERHGVYKVHELDSCDVDFNVVRDLIGGYAEAAMKMPRGYDGPPIGKALENELIMWCDADGYPKHLDVTYFRDTDRHPLVGKLVWCSNVMVYTMDGPDYSLQALSDSDFEAVVAYLKRINWSEAIVDDEPEPLVDLGGAN